MAVMNWGRVLALLGEDVVHVDGSIFWDNSTIDGERRKFAKCRIGIFCLKNSRYHSETLDRNEIRVTFDRLGLIDDQSRKNNIVSFVEARAIARAANLYPGFQIESDSQSAVVEAKALMPDLNIVWRPRADLPMSHAIAKTTPDGIGIVEIRGDRPRRDWLCFVPDTGKS